MKKSEEAVGDGPETWRSMMGHLKVYQVQRAARAKSGPRKVAGIVSSLR